MAQRFEAWTSEAELQLSGGDGLLLGRNSDATFFAFALDLSTYTLFLSTDLGLANVPEKLLFVSNKILVEIRDGVRRHFLVSDAIKSPSHKKSEVRIVKRAKYVKISRSTTNPFQDMMYSIVQRQTIADMIGVDATRTIS